MKNFHWRDSIIYQIYPKSFQDSNGDGIGDLNGIIQRLDYLKSGKSDSLNVDAIWISPFYPSPMKDGGYDISDYCNVDPQFGTLADFERLLTEAHSRNLRVIIDFVPNHTSNEHPWFKLSRSSKTNKKRDWYIWRKPKADGSPPNNWISVFGGPAWTLDTKTGMYYLHSFVKEQPDLNWENPEVKKAMFDVMRFWLEKGVDGIRVDAFNQALKDYTFPDEPMNPAYNPERDDPYRSLLHVYAKDVAGKLPLLKELCDVIDEYDHRLLVTEAYLELDDLLNYYRVGEKETLSPFNFFMLLKPWEAPLFSEILAGYEKGRRPHDIGNFVLSNHDNRRVTERIGRDAARSAAILLFTLRGIPFVYYGDEIGMKDSIIPLSKTQDPRGKQNPKKKLSRDPSRTPMQWDSKKNAGFSLESSWLPVAPDYVEYNVEREQSDSSSFLSLYKSLMQLRHKSTSLRRGKYIPLELPEKDILVFLREYGSERILVIINFSDKESQISLPFSKGTILCHSDMKGIGRNISLKKLSLHGNEAYVIKLP